MEERVGFEPTNPLSRVNGFQDRRIRPLCHLSNDLYIFQILSVYYEKIKQIICKLALPINALDKDGAPEGSRTSNLQIRSLTLYPIELRALKFSGGERGIRTLVPHF
jgi:hypothetical protein